MSILNIVIHVLPLFIVFLFIFVVVGKYNSNKHIIKEANKQNEQRDKKRQDDLELAQQMINNGTKVYINGILIDATKIILKYYDIEFCEDYIILYN